MNSTKFADKGMIFLKKYKNYNHKEELLAHYGLETIYILITKMLFITLVSILIGITKEMYIFIIFYFFLRFYASGLHLSKSIHCTIMSTTILIGFPLLAIYTNFALPIRLIINGIVICLFAFYSPADTIKKPLINYNKRINLKIKSIMICFIYFILTLFIKSNFILNCITYSLILQTILIVPITYKTFNMPYNNYLNYKEKE